MYTTAGLAGRRHLADLPLVPAADEEIAGAILDDAQTCVASSDASGFSLRDSRSVPVLLTTAPFICALS